MPNKKISQLPKLHAPEQRDFLPVIEISDGLNKAIELSALGDFSGNYNMDRDGSRILLTNQNSNQIVLSSASTFLAGLMSAQDKLNLTLAISALSANGFLGAGGYNPTVPIDYIVAAGGGGAGGTYYSIDSGGRFYGLHLWATSGGGGAGGIKTGTLTTIQPGFTVDFQVGAGGEGGTVTGTAALSTIMASRGSQGGTSRIVVQGTTLVTTTGGGGAGSSANPDGQTGGSGGGGGAFFHGRYHTGAIAGGTGVGGSGTAGQGNSGGAGFGSSSGVDGVSDTGGGGGGAASAGGSGSSSGFGGLSAEYWTTMFHPLSVELRLGRGGNGFGAASSANNTGNGASGRVASTSSAAGIAGQPGGSGVIWVRYLKSVSPSVGFLGASVVDTTTNRQLSSYWVHKFTETTGAIEF